VKEGARSDYCGQEGLARPDEREGRRKSKAQIIERDGQVWMVKDCPLHGHYEDMMAVDSKWLSWIERQYPGRDIPAHNDEDLHKHGFQHGALRPRVGAHRRPYESLQT